MIDEQIRTMVRTLFNQGKAKKAIARIANINIKTVRVILASTDDKPKERSDKINVSEELLQKLQTSCKGYAERIYEKLTDEYEIQIGYSTLTKRLRDLDIGKKLSRRSDHYDDVPGEEMQHDTSPYTLEIGEKRRTVICSGLYLRYSKMRYIKFYPSFNRFAMKCFLHEALLFFGYTAGTCIIDNTNLAVLYGTGENAVFNPEMVQFANQFPFNWKAHRIKHSNRKAGVERNFYTVETSFFPGRTFASIEDLNTQAFQWATVRYASRPQSKTRLIPSELFEYEKPFLLQIDNSILPPYREHHRLLDTYGYIAFNGNYFWVPKTDHGRNVTVFEYEKVILIYQNHEKLLEYSLPEYGVKNKRFSPPGVKTNAQPNNRKKRSLDEEKHLRTLDPVCCSYLDFIHSGECQCRQKSKLIRDLYALSKKVSRGILIETMARALEYKVFSLQQIENIARNSFNTDFSPETVVDSGSEYQNRKEYYQGQFSSEANIDTFQNLLEDHKNDE
ncbi:MAG: helix-turn-helix domain-containing protein [Candidatus Heimdallarchaeota archaeon]|nr:helix-turn-helix domain-containing protein [Candidatus Heimdallarchaeota archaeon]